MICAPGQHNIHASNYRILSCDGTCGMWPVDCTHTQTLYYIYTLHFAAPDSGLHQTLSLCDDNKQHSDNAWHHGAPSVTNTEITHPSLPKRCSTARSTSVPFVLPSAFEDSMIRGVLRVTLPIAFRCVLHRCENQDIRCPRLLIGCCSCCPHHSQRLWNSRWRWCGDTQG